MDAYDEPVLSIRTCQKRFVLAQITDLHLAFRYFLKRFHLSRLKGLLQRCAPDLVVNTGDFFCRRESHSPLGLLDLYGESLGRRWPWAFAWGNHDNELGEEARAAVERYLVAAEEIWYPDSAPFFGERRQAEEAGEPETEPFYGGNYAIELFNERSASRKPAWQLFIFNSRRQEQVPPLVLDWAAQRCARYGGTVPVLCFMHRPVFELGLMAEADRVEGFAYERVNSGPDRGVHARLRAMGSVKAVFSGHDHRNNFHCAVDGIRYHSARKTLSLAYGAESVENFIRRKNRRRPAVDWGLTEIILDMGSPSMRVATVLGNGRRELEYEV